ncbi:MAG: DUF1800 domain-containing protein [Actinomycetota bacterium]
MGRHSHHSAGESPRESGVDLGADIEDDSPSRISVATRHGERSGEQASTGPRHSTDRGMSRRGLIGALSAGAVVSACGTTAAVAPRATENALKSVAGVLGGDRGSAAAARSLARDGAKPPVGMVEQARPSMKPAVSNSSFGAAGDRPPKPSTSKVIKQPPTPLSTDQALHLARRASWGPTAALVKEMSKDSTAWLERQLKPEAIDDSYVQGLVGQFDTLGLAPARLKAMNEAREKNDGYFYAHDQLEIAAIWRAAYSKRQLLEVMVDWAHNRLHVPSHFDKGRDTLNQYDTLVIRPYALGKFKDMLWGMLSKSPAMLFYLDNQNNTKDGGNQNLGRELLELHTLGVDSGYTQKDVEAASLLLTGLGIDEQMNVKFFPKKHHVGAVKVFGRTYKNASASGGLATIKELSDDLAMDPKTAYSVALDLARRFVSDSPPVVLIERLASIYRKNDSALAPVLRELFTSAEFKASIGQKYRRPMENMVATLRVLDVKPSENRTKVIETFKNLRWTLSQMDQAPYEHNAPDGHADYARRWLSTTGVLSRWNMQMALAAGWHEGLTDPDMDDILAGSDTWGDAVRALFERLLFTEGTSSERGAVLTFLEKKSSESLSARERKDNYNLRARAAALILGTVHHQLR